MSTKSIVVVPSKMFQVPSEDQITEVRHLSGENPKLENIKDHPEWNGQMIIVLAAELHPGTIPNNVTGEIHDYYVFPALIYPEGEAPDQAKHGHLLNSSATNITARISDAVTERAFPIRGKLRKSGRAWFID